MRRRENQVEKQIETNVQFQLIQIKPCLEDLTLGLDIYQCVFYTLNEWQQTKRDGYKRSFLFLFRFTQLNARL